MTNSRRFVPDSSGEQSDPGEQTGNVDTYWNVSRENDESSETESDRDDTRYDQADEAGGVSNTDRDFWPIIMMRKRLRQKPVP